jgi:hypothetical protein
VIEETLVASAISSLGMAAAGYRNDIVCVMHGFPCSLVGMPWLMQPGLCLTHAAINRNIQNWPFGYEQGFPMGN